MKRLLAASLAAIELAALAPSAAAQNPPPVVESIEVRVASVEVIVTDSAGRHVHGLRQSDFQLFEDGQPQPLTNFYEVGPEEVAVTSAAGASGPAAAAEPSRRRHIILFVDSYSLHPFHRNAVLTSLTRFAEREVRAGDSVAVVEWTASGTKTHVPFTDDMTTIRAGLDHLRTHANAASVDRDHQAVRSLCTSMHNAALQRVMSMHDAEETCRLRAEGEEDREMGLLQNLATSIHSTAAAMAGLEGRKVLVLAGSYLPQRPGLELEFFIRSLFEGAPERAQTSTPSSSVTLEAIAREANASGVSIYTVDASTRDDVIGSDKSQLPSPAEAFTKQVNTDFSYERISSATGGSMFHTATQFDAAFDAIGADLASYYSLGYRPSSAGREHQIEVRTRDRSLHVRTRNSLALKTRLMDAEDRVIANLYRDVGAAEWPLRLQLGTAIRDGRNFRIPVEVEIPSTLLLLPAGDRLTGSVTVLWAAGSSIGDASNVTSKRLAIDIPASDESSFRSKPISFHVEVLVRPGSGTVSIAAIDETAGTSGFSRQRYDAR